MPYTQEEGGKLNNFAIEPKMYAADSSTNKDKRNYLIVGVLGIVLVVGLIAVVVLTSKSA
jgi:hypothetical protein